MMLRRELMRVGLSAAVGLLLGLVLEGARGMLPFALYAVGLFYGFRFVLPALLGSCKTFGNAGIMSIVFKNPWGFLLFLFLGLLAVGVLVTVAWIVGIGAAALRLWRAWQEDRAMGTPFRPHNPFSGRSQGGQQDGGWGSGGWDD